jgi:hypothetical protein
MTSLIGAGIATTSVMSDGDDSLSICALVMPSNARRDRRLCTIPIGLILRLAGAADHAHV